MADSENLNPKVDPEQQPPSNLNQNGLHDADPEEPDDDEFEEEEEEEDDDDDDEPPPLQRKPSSEESLRSSKAKMEGLFRRMETEKVDLRVHDVVIRGNTKTKEYLIEAELEGIRKATTMQELLEASAKASAKLKELDIFDSVRITLDSGPPELPRTANVLVDVVETESVITGELGCYTKPAARSWTAEGSLKFKNLFGYGDMWDGSLAYGPSQTSEISAGVLLPRFKGFVTPVTARVFLLSQDWLELSSYKERMAGLSLSLFSTRHHDVVYNLGWRTLTDPSQMASKSIRRQLGHGLLSSIKYTFTLDRRNSYLRPTRGYSFVSSSHVGGLSPDSRSVRFLRQELDLRYAVPFGFYHAALNFGVSGGVVFPWGNGFLNKPSSLPERFFLGGDFSPVCTPGGPATVWGFKTRALGPTEPRRHVRDNSNDENSESSGRDFVGGDLALSAFADISFDLPLRWLRERGVHGHVFAGAGNVAKLSENEFRKFSLQRFFESFRSSVGAGIVIPTKLFRLECNYYYILKQFEHDGGKTGFRFSISAPSL
ncbi:uncharacterized protein LOC133715336 [Rosa rugosa]|uniref:uncharacterized protein LOC133715336 n=1 Tax=Rosa rugosa TaxID=74645 RepID=UPI002B411077|nr:uncharacterized protein LOC133715336 [Rosa rugosa]XP_061997790.1 uncharacterized protein LOC133715336 [Rosa rugosa]